MSKNGRARGAEGSRRARRMGACAGWVIGLAGGMPAGAAAQQPPPVERLPEVVVSASRVPLPAEQVGSAVTVITGAELERQQIRIVSDALRKVPGVAVSRFGPPGTFTQARIRGAEANQTLVIIDGVEVNDPSGGSEFDLGNLLAADIERIEVLRGPQSALYGSDAIGGVINIVTRRGRGPARGQVSLEGGSFRTGQASASLAGGGERYHFALGGTVFRTGGVSVAPESQGNTEDDGHRNRTVNLKLGAEPIDGLELELSGRYVNATVETDPQPAVAGVIRTVDGNSETDTIQRSAGARVRYSLLDGTWEHVLGVGFNEERADSLTNGAVSFEADGEKIRLDYQSNLFFETPALAGATHSLTVLLEREDESQVTRSAFGGSDLDITNYGYVGEYRLGLWDRLFLSGSVRHDDNDIFKDATTYRATAAYLHEPSATRLHASYGTGVKNPTLFELFGFGPSFVPNPNLRPEESDGWDLGIEQRLLDERLSVDVTYFNNRISDLIQGAGNTAVNLAGTSRIQGLEVSARAELGERLALSGQYTFTDGEDATGARLVRRPRHLASANLHYRFAGGRASVDVGLDYTGKQRDIEFSSFFLARRTVTLDGFLLVNVAGSYALGKGVELYGRVENLLDEDYQQVLGYSNPGIGVFLGIRTTVGPF